MRKLISCLYYTAKTSKAALLKASYYHWQWVAFRVTSYRRRPLKPVATATLPLIYPRAGLVRVKPVSAREGTIERAHDNASTIDCQELFARNVAGKVIFFRTGILA